MPLVVCLSLGFIIGAISPAILVPSMIILIEKGFGKDKLIPQTLIVSGTIDVLVAIVCFGITSSFAL